MVLSLLFISILVPIFGTAILSYVFERFIGLLFSSSLLVFIVWLPLYLWIIQLPNIPPKQALDWLWIYMILVSIGTKFMVIKYNSVKSKAIYQSIVFLIIGSLMIWPAISYNASITSHWLIWLETITFAALSVYILFMLTTINFKHHKSNVIIIKNTHLWLFTGSLSFTVILTGSLLIGELLLSLSSVFFTLGLYCKFRNNLKVSINGLPITYGLALLFLLISRVYVEVDIINTALLMLSIILSSLIIIHPQKNKFPLLAFIGTLCGSLAYSFYTEVLNVPNNGYY